MDTQEVHDLTDDDDLSVYRDRTKTMLDQVARLTKQTLAEHTIDLDVFFLVPNTGEAIIMFGTPTDPDDATWERVGNVVSSALQQVAGVNNTRCRPVLCSTTTDAVADDEHSVMSIPMVASLAGADQ